MVGKDMVVQNFGSLTSSFKVSALQRQSGNASGDFGKTMSEVQDNQSKSSDRQVKRKSSMDISKRMKKLTASDKPSVDSKESLKQKDTKADALDCENAVEKITELVTEIMDVTEKELMDLLEKSGIQLLDLLNPDNLKQFVLDANGCEDAISLITNEGVAEQFNQLLGALKDVELETLKNISDEVKEEQFDMEQTEADVSGHETKIVVEKDTSSKDMANSEFDRNQESAADNNPVDLFIQNLTAKSADNVNQASAEQVQVMREIVNQIVEKIKVTIKPESTSMELQLNPESLGRVDLTVASKNGVLTASFTAENQIAKEAIESQMQVLKDNLNNQGVKVEAIEVTVAEFGFRQNTESGADAQGQSKQQKKTGTRRINLDSFNEESVDISEEEALAARVLRDNGGTVDYTA